MKLTNNKIKEIALQINGITDKKLPIKLSFALQKNIKALASAEKEYEEARKKILEDNAEKDEDGKPIIEEDRYKINDMDKVTNDIVELLNIEVDLDIHEVGIEVLEQCDLDRYDTLTPRELALLEFMIKE